MRFQTLFLPIAIFLITPQLAQAGEWPKHSVNLKNREQNIVTFQKQLEVLIKRKKAAPTPDAKRKHMAEILEMHEKVQSMIERNHEEKKHIRYEHPAKGKAIEQKYKHFKNENIEEVVDEGGVDGTLNRIRAKMRSIFQRKKEKKKAVGQCTEKDETCKKPIVKATPRPTPTPEPTPERPKLSL